MATVEEKNGHIAANAEARVEDENGGQDHCYSEVATPGHIAAEFEGKGENDKRVVKASKTGGRHVTSKNGLDVAKQRSAHVQANRKASAKLFDSKRLSVVPERKGRR